MATSTTTGFPRAIAAPNAETIRAGANRRRRIDPQAGHALEILGHAIEYLADEFVHAGGSFSADNGQLQAVQLLMALNRQVYFECPEVPPFSKRLLSFLHLKRGLILASMGGRYRSVLSFEQLLSAILPTR
jgi:hypothetical protein